ncbi:MAG TPA: 5'/3'-nucleotidase SurE [Cryptosporangiaceae bacterium]|nr:5'/3'-nucleotidase SurE [Cryptosporangiaceae bacterium]
MTLVLITNDDGIDAPGLHRLAVAVAAAGYDVVVAAPSAEASGSGAALTAVTEDGRIVVEKRELTDAPDLTAYAVGASPAYIALLATIGAFGAAPDLVLSGINRGANAGHAVLHSGTVGAALTAAQSGCRAMAVSLDVLFPAAASGSDVDAAIAAFKDGQQTRHWDTAADLAVDLLPELAGTPAGTVLNLNVPDAPPERLRGVRRGTLGGFGQVQMAVAETGEGFVRTTVAENGDRPRPGTDVAWLADGYACVGVVRGVVDVPDLPLRLPADPDGAAPT